MILNCAIIDEDPGALELLKKYVDEMPTLNLIGAYPSAIHAVDGIRHNHLDILFLINKISWEINEIVKSPKNASVMHVFSVCFLHFKF